MKSKRRVNMARAVAAIEKRINHLSKRLATDFKKKLTYDREERSSLSYMLELMDKLVQENNLYRQMLNIEERFEDGEEDSETFRDSH